jgi:hypothetical protein
MWCGCWRRRLIAIEVIVASAAECPVMGDERTGEEMDGQSVYAVVQRVAAEG